MQASAEVMNMTITGKNEIVLKNILIGDVWLCGGQSNMEWTMEKSKDAERHIAEAKFPQIRLFTVARTPSFTKQTDVPEAKWTEATGQNIAAFSAVGYQFGKLVHLEQNNNHSGYD